MKTTFAFEAKTPEEKQLRAALLEYVTAKEITNMKQVADMIFFICDSIGLDESEFKALLSGINQLVFKVDTGIDPADIVAAATKAASKLH